MQFHSHQRDILTRCLLTHRYFRPAEVDILHGDASKAERLLGWKRQIDFDTLVKEMVEADLAGEFASCKRGVMADSDGILMLLHSRRGATRRSQLNDLFLFKSIESCFIFPFGVSVEVSLFCNGSTHVI